MEDFTRLDKLLDGFAQKTVPCCGCAIMRGDEILYEGYKGYANLEEKIPLNKNHMFRQASTTKLFTYTIMAMLFEEGKLLFSDPIGEYLPGWKNTTKYVQRENGGFEVVPTKHPITIKDAASMSCGLPYCMFPDENARIPTLADMSKRIGKLLEEKGVPTLRDEVRVMADVPVMFEPGTHWLYGFGSEIIGALVETIEGKPLRRVFEDRLIHPLGLKNTATYCTDENRDRVLVNYEKLPDGTLRPFPAGNNSDVNPDISPEGARPNLLSSPADFATFMQMLANGGTWKGERFLGKGTVEMMTANCLNAEQLEDFSDAYLNGYGYGLGFRTLIDKAKGSHNGNLGAFGWTGGGGTWAEADPIRRVSLVYMHNMFPNEELYHHHRFRNVAYGCL